VRLSLGSYRSGLITLALRLSVTNRLGAPPKKPSAATFASIHVASGIATTGRTNRCREQLMTITNDHTRRALPVAGSVHWPR
jgi:hypothetical protein